MRLLIDTKEKTVELQENVNIDDLISELKKLFPDDYKQYTIIPAVETVTYPIYYDNNQPVTVPYYGDQFVITC